METPQSIRSQVHFTACCLLQVRRVFRPGKHALYFYRIASQGKSAVTVLHTSFSVPLVNLRATHSTDTSAAVSDADISIIIEIEQSKHPGNLILPKSADPAAPPASGCLWLGGYQACRAPFLQARKITVVLNVAKSLEKFYPAWGKEVAQLEAEKAITVRRVLWIDDTNQEIPVAELVELCRWIHTSLQRANVLVHCAQGKSRSATAVLAYVMVINNLSFADALTQVVRPARQMAEPNQGFERRLHAFYTSLDFQQLRKELLSSS